MFKLCTQPYSIDDLDDILTEAMKEGKQTNNQNITFWNIVFAFDIETTSFTDKITKETLRGCVILCNGAPCKNWTKLKDGDQVTLLPPVAGG